MLELKECRETLAPEISQSLSDEELILVRDELQALAEVFVDFELEQDHTPQQTV